jgi:putative transposase
MGRTEPLTRAERERIYQEKLAGSTLQEIAVHLARSVEVVKKWWRRARGQGVAGLEARPPGSKSHGPLARFDARVAQAALDLKRSHRRWGAQRVLLELRQRADLCGLPLPSPSRLAVYFKTRCPEQVASHHARLQPILSAAAGGVHDVWQLDNQEHHVLADGTIATVCTIRDPFGAALLASQAFAVKTEKHWRKLDWTEVRSVLRAAFTEWQTLPDRVRTDNELCLAGTPTDPFPSKLTLWLSGVGVVHEFIRPHCPTDQAQVERSHRTLDGLTLDDASRATLATFQQALERERFIYNHEFPVRASDCHGRPPLQAHPELVQPRRPYRPEWEIALFDLQRVYDHLATLRLERKVNTSGQVSLGRILYALGRQQAGKTVQVRCDPQTREWIFLERNTEPPHEIARRAVKGVNVTSLTGLEDRPATIPVPIQLTLPYPG